MDPHQPQGSPRTRVRDSMSKPASPFLQEHLLARRGHNKPSRRSDFGPRSRTFDDDLFAAEAETNAKTDKHGTASSHQKQAKGSPSKDKHGASQPKNLGAREMDKHMDKLTKSNFDLKMELFHCRERMAALQEQCEALAEHNEAAEKRAEHMARDRDHLAGEVKTLMALNEEMVRDLKMRDEAVKEAVNIICDLEEKVENLEQCSLAHKPEIPHTPTSSKTPERQWKSPNQEQAQFLPPTSKKGARRVLPYAATSASQKRVPSFLCEKKPSTNALRSVYLEPASHLRAVRSYASILSQQDELHDMDALDSPRLSVLSESSFPSIYGPNKPSDTQHDDEELTVDHQSASQRGHDRYQNDNSRINEWVANRIPRDAPTTERLQPRSRFRQTSSELDYQSLDDPTFYGNLQEAFNENDAPAVARRKPPRVTRSSSGGHTFGPSRLPPTPESASTRLLRPSHSTLGDGRSAVLTPDQADIAVAPKRQPSSVGSQANIGTPARTLSHTSRQRETNAPTDWNKHSQNISSSEEETDDGSHDESRDDSSGTLRVGEGETYCPNGGSIVTGTPSRFQVRHTSPPAHNIVFDGDGIDDVERPRGKRRNTGSDARDIPTKPPRRSLPRAETSPLLLGPTNDDQRDDISRSRKVAIKAQETDPGLDKRGVSSRVGLQRSSSKHESRSAALNGPSMRMSFTQKTQKLFGRKSDSRGDSPAAGRVVATMSNTSSAIPQASPTRPRTAHPIGTATHQNGTDSLLDSRSNAARPRPASQDSDLALVAANQAIASRRLSHQSQSQYAGKGSLSPPATSGSRNFFKRAGSVRR